MVRSDGRSGWVLDDTGVLHGFGGPGNVSTGVLIDDPVAAAIDDDGRGYVLDVDGALYPAGGARAESVQAEIGGASAVDLDVRADGGGWVLDDRGRVHGFGGVASDRVHPPEAVRGRLDRRDRGRRFGCWMPMVSCGRSVGPGWCFLYRPTQPRATPSTSTMSGSVYSPAFVNGDDARFINGVYQLFLGREPSTVETELEVTALEQGRRRSELTGSLARSAHWSGGAVDEMYRNALGREPDPDGRAYWLGEIENGLQVQDLGTYFYGLVEYANAAGSHEAYVAGLYQVLLNRQPDDEGLNYWAGLLAGGQADPPDVANGFYASIESRRDRATRLHERILGTAPDEESRQYWADRLLVTGDGGVAAEMAGSSTYYRLVVDGPEP